MCNGMGQERIVLCGEEAGEEEEEEEEEEKEKLRKRAVHVFFSWAVFICLMRASDHGHGSLVSEEDGYCAPVQPTCIHGQRKERRRGQERAPTSTTM